MKGISTIIATIIMVVITIGLISVAYLYMSGLITGATAQNIALLDAYCDAATNNIFALIKNDGTTAITFNLMSFYVNGTTTGITVLASCTGAGNSLAAGATQNCMFNGTSNGFNEVRIVGPSNAVGGTIECK
jgi:FlaG/FlaF family flagellin (archaellin)